MDVILCDVRLGQIVHTIFLATGVAGKLHRHKCEAHMLGLDGMGGKVRVDLHSARTDFGGSLAHSLTCTANNLLGRHNQRREG